MARVDEAVKELRRRILNGEYAPGVALTAAELSAELGMSRTPVRDALRVLSAEGLVDVRVNRIARVTSWSRQEIEGVFDVRLRLEGMAAGLAAERCSAAQADELESLALEIKRWGDPGPAQDLGEVEPLNTEFHGRIIDIAGVPSLTTAMSGVIHAALLTRTRAGYTEDEQRRSSIHHLELVAAFRARSSEWAESVMRSHLLQAKFAVLHGYESSIQEGTS